MNVKRYVLVEIESFPKPMEQGKLYWSRRFGAAAHLCACGCGSEVITPLTPVQWKISFTPRGPSLRPSIGNWRFACQSHYWIIDGDVRWAKRMSDHLVLSNRLDDEKLRDAYFKSLPDADRQSSPTPPRTTINEPSWLQTALAWLKKIIG